MRKQDWGFLTFWAALAAIAVAGGRGLASLGHPLLGRRIFYTGLILAALLGLGEVGRWAAGGVKAVSNPFLRAVQRTARFLIDVFAWFGALLLAPVIRRALSWSDYPEAIPHTWTAYQKRGKQGSDFLAIARDGYRVAGARFSIRPDRSLPGWHAGFRLTPRGDKLAAADVSSTLLVQVSATFFGPQQDGYACARDGAVWGPYGLPVIPVPPPSRLFDVSVSPYQQGPEKLQVTYQIDGQAPQWLEFRTEYGEQLVLVAWADGQDFRVEFEQISVGWSPLRGRKK